MQVNVRMIKTHTFEIKYETTDYSLQFKIRLGCKNIKSKEYRKMNGPKIIRVQNDLQDIANARVLAKALTIRT